MTPEQTALILANRGLAHWQARKLRHDDVCTRADLKDLKGAGLLALCQAALTFDPARGTRFTTHAFWAIRHAIQDEARHAGVITLPSQAIACKFRTSPRYSPRTVELISRAFHAQSLSACPALDPHEAPESVQLHARPDEGPGQVDTADMLAHLLGCLDDRERAVIEGLFLEGLILRVMGARLGLSREAVRNIRDKAMARLQREASRCR